MTNMMIMTKMMTMMITTIMIMTITMMMMMTGGLVGLEAWQVYAGSETHQGAANPPAKVAQILERI